MNIILKIFLGALIIQHIVEALVFIYKHKKNNKSKGNKNV